MKKSLLLAAFFAIVLIAGLVFAAPSLIVISTPGTLQGYSGDDVSGTFTIKNNGDVNLTDITFTPGELKDDDDDVIDLTFDLGTVTVLLIGNETEVEVIADISEDMDPGTYSTSVLISGNSTEDPLQSTNVSMALSVKVKKEFCEDGAQGSKIIIKRIEEPDSGDEFRAGDTIPVEVDVKNDYSKDLDVVLEAWLFDIDEDISLDEAETELSIDNGDTETLQVDLKIPADVDTANDFIVLIKVYEDGNEDDECKDDFVPIEITKDSHRVLLDKVTTNPEPVQCGGALSVQLEFINAGKNDEDDVMVRIYNVALDIDEDKTFSLDEGDDYKVSFNSLLIPKDAEEGEYTLTIEWFYDYDDGNDEYDESDNAEKKITVKGNCKTEVQDVLMSVQQLTSAMPGEELSFKVTLTNTGTKETTYTLSASGYESWASLTSVEPTSLALASEETSYSYIKLLPNSNVAGSNSFTVKITFGGETKTQTVSVNFMPKTEEASVFEQLLFSIRHNMEWFLINLILVIAIIVLFVLLLRKKSPRQSQVLVVGGKKRLEQGQGQGPTEISLAKSKPKAARKTRRTRRTRRRK